MIAEHVQCALYVFLLLVAMRILNVARIEPSNLVRTELSSFDKCVNKEKHGRRKLKGIQYFWHMNIIINCEGKQGTM